MFSTTESYKKKGFESLVKKNIIKNLNLSFVCVTYGLSMIPNPKK